MDLSTATMLRTEYEARVFRGSDLGAHLPHLYEVTRGYDKPTVIELGVRDGVSTAAFLYAMSAIGGHCYSVDVAHPNVPMWWADTGLWDFIVEDDLSPEALQFVPREADILFIDTSHHYEQTLKELRAYHPRVRSGGVVLMHDTELERPEKYEGDPFPVARALDDYCLEVGATWTNRPGDSGLGIIEVP